LPKHNAIGLVRFPLGRDDTVAGGVDSAHEAEVPDVGKLAGSLALAADVSHETALGIEHGDMRIVTPQVESASGIEPEQGCPREGEPFGDIEGVAEAENLARLLELNSTSATSCAAAWGADVAVVAATVIIASVSFNMCSPGKVPTNSSASISANIPSADRARRTRRVRASNGTAGTQDATMACRSS